MTDQPPTDPTHGTQRPADPPAPAGPPPPPPAFAAAPPPAPAPWTAPPAATPAFAGPPAPARATGSPYRPRVALIGVLALLAVIGAIVWNGGGSDTAGPAGPGGLGGPGGGSGQVGIPGSSGSSGSSGSGGGGSSSGGSTASPGAVSGPIDPTDLGPSGASMTPTDPGTVLQWRLPGNWQDQIATYRGSFPAAGYELYAEVGGETTNSAGEPVAIFYEVVPVGAAYYDSVGYLEFQPDPADPEGSTYLIWRTSL